MLLQPKTQMIEQKCEIKKGYNKIMSNIILCNVHPLDNRTNHIASNLLRFWWISMPGGCFTQQVMHLIEILFNMSF